MRSWRMLRTFGQQLRQRALVIATLLIAAFFLVFFARAGLSSFFSDDDLMNLYLAWQLPLPRIFLGNLLFFSAALRPLGALAYRVLFGIGGFHPAFFRAAAFGILLLNLFVLYRAAARIASRETALLAVLIASYNTGFVDLYYSTGTIYDALCFTFYFLAFTLYVDVRGNGYFTRKPLLIFLLLYICALNSKEMAVTLPAVLCVWELIWGGRLSRKHLFRRWIPCGLSVIATVLYVLGKLSPPSPLTGNEGYRMHLGVRTYFRALAHYFALLTFNSFRWFTLGRTVWLIVAAIVLAAVLRRRSLTFALAFLLIAPLPMAFVALRSAYVMYIPMFGISVYLACVMVRVRDMLVRASPTATVQVATVLCSAAILFALHLRHPLPRDANTLNRDVANQLIALKPPIRPDSRVLFLDDPFPADSWNLTYLLGLYYRYPALIVDRAKAPERGIRDSHDIVFGMEDGRLTELKPRR